MFRTTSRSRLSEFSDYFDRIVRDGTFYAVGKAQTRGSSLLVPIWDKRFVQQIVDSDDVSCVVCNSEIAHLVPERFGVAVAGSPKTTAMLISGRLNLKPDYYWHSFDSIIPSSCNIHPSACISERDVILGEKCEIGPNTTILERTILGDSVVIGPNCSIGTDAFDCFELDGRPVLVPQAGGVKIGDRTVILANSCIDRSCFASAWTTIGEDCIIDKLTNLAHDVVVGARCRIGGSVGIFGRVTIGPDSYVAPTAIIVNGITLGSKTYVTMGSMVTKDVQDGERVTGYFAEPHKNFMERLKRRQLDV